MMQQQYMTMVANQITMQNLEENHRKMQKNYLNNKLSFLEKMADNVKKSLSSFYPFNQIN